MKKLAAFLLAILLCVTTAFAETINLDLSAATDQELADALQKIVAEQKSRIKTTLTLDQAELTLGKGKKETLTATIEGLPEGMDEPKVVWDTSDEKIATVSKGKVSGVDAGTATITATITLEDGIELTAECKVTVVVAVTGLKASESSYSLQMNESVTMETTVSPKNATNQKIDYESSDTSVATVSAKGTIKAVGAGKCTITATTVDGGKSASCTVKVSSFSGVPENYTVTSKQGSSFFCNYFGNANDLSVTDNSSSYASVQYTHLGSILMFEIMPTKAGSFTITLEDEGNSGSKVKCKVTIDPQATYSKQSYPSIDYDGAARYPDSYKGDQTSFSGKVLQVIEGYGYTAYRISSKGNYDNVVYVTLDDDEVTVPLIEDDKVTVYGAYAGNYSYTTVMGSKLTIPKVDAERINLR